MALMYLGRSGVMGSVSAHILPVWLKARQVSYGGGIGGGIMTAESISASRAAVRSKSQHGENMKGGKLLRRSGLAQPCALT